MGEDFRMISLEIALAVATVGAADQGPINIYVANDQLNVAQIAESIVAAGPLDRNDRIQQEQAERAVFLIGVVTPGTDRDTMSYMEQQGVIKKTIRWTFSNPEGWAIVAFNNGGAALTTGTVLRFSVKYFGVWVT